MKGKLLLILANILVLALIGLSVWRLTAAYQRQTAPLQTASNSDQYAYLTTTALRALAPLPETNRIIPTDQVRAITLEAKETEVKLLPGVRTKAFTYNGQTPGPVIRVTEGDTVAITIKNGLQVATSIHFHGMHLPNNMDGVPPLTQQEILPGQSFSYRFIAGHAGTYMYHPHVNTVEQVDKGLYGAFIIEPQDHANQPVYDRDITMVFGGWNVPPDSYDPEVLQNEFTSKNGGSAVDNMDGMAGMEGMVNPDTGPANSGGSMNMNYNFWTINGKAFPANQVIKVKKGERARIRMVNPTNNAHPMHLHGGDFRVIAEDSHPLGQPRILNTLDVAPGKTFDIDFIADNPGKWVFHCHELHHAENDGVEPGGLMGVIQVL